MTIDERIEALTHSVELLASFHRDMEQRTEEHMAGIRAHTAVLTDTMNRLANIVIHHDEQIEDHDRRLKDLED